MKTKFQFILNQTIAGIAVTFVCLFSVTSARASLILTYAAQAGVTTSSVAGSTVETFDSLPLNQVDSTVLTLGDGNIATINNVFVMPANWYGGAVDSQYPNGSPFAVQSQGGTEGISGGPFIHDPVSTISFAKPISYFGLWWSAGDSANYLYFYNGTNLLAYMNTTGLIQEVSANTNHTAYYGNPAGGYKGSDSGEPFAFLNFFAVGTPITSIVLSNSASSGFESDNWTFRTAAYGTSPTDGSVLPGIAVEQVTGHTVTAYTNNMTGFTDSGIPVNIASVPEPSSFAMFAIGGLLLGGYAWRKKQRTV